jgi:hypothetical protein
VCPVAIVSYELDRDDGCVSVRLRVAAEELS